MDIEETIKRAAEPHLVASLKEATALLSELNVIISDLRADVSQKELEADLHLNELFQESETGIDKTRAVWKVSPIYREWKDKSGKLSDLRAIRRNLDRHCDLLSSQERFGTRTPSYLG
jgi:hypothetical protein